MCFIIDVQRCGVMFDISGAVLKFTEHIESTAVLRHVSFFGVVVGGHVCVVGLFWRQLVFILEILGSFGVPK